MGEINFVACIGTRIATLDETTENNLTHYGTYIIIIASSCTLTPRLIIMVTLKLSRTGKKKQPQYRLIVTEKGRDPWGRVQEILGHYNPLVAPKTFTVNKERLDFYLKHGAQCTFTVHNLLVTHGYVADQKIASQHKRTARPKKK